MRLTTTEANDQYKQAINELHTQYGSWTAIPKDLLREASETLRLHHIINVHEGQVNRSILSQYMIPESVIAKVNPDFSGFEPKQRRSDKYVQVYQWLDSNPGVEVTTAGLTEVADISYSTALKFIENNPQYFRKVKRGTYQVRDPKAERDADK